MRGWRRSIWFLLLLLTSSTASAQTSRAFGEPGTITISAERLFGFTRTRTTWTQPAFNIEETRTGDTFSLFGSPFSGGPDPFFTFPRVALDAFVARHLSIGGALGVFHASDVTSLFGGGLRDSITGFVVAPRLGISFPVGSGFYIWPRAGITYVAFWIDQSSAGSAAPLASGSGHLLAATASVDLTIMISPRTAILVGPTLDVSFYGDIEARPGPSVVGGMPVTTEIRERDYGLQASLLVVL